MNFILAIVVNAYNIVQVAIVECEVEMDIATDLVYLAEITIASCRYKWPPRLRVMLWLTRPGPKYVSVEDLQKLLRPLPLPRLQRRAGGGRRSESDLPVDP